MAVNKARLALLFGIVGSCLAFDVWAHWHRPILAHANGYSRSKYYTRNPRRPFTFASRYTVTTEGVDHVIRADITQAQDSQGRWLYARRQFVPASDSVPTIESDVLVEGPGDVTTYFSSKWQIALGKPGLTAHGLDPRSIQQHTLPENNCTSPEPTLTFLRYEHVLIGGDDYPAAVVQFKDDLGTHLIWHAMTPGLGCLELKSVDSYVLPDKNRGITVHEPLSLTLSEPDSQLLDLHARISAASAESVPFDRWDEEVKLKTKAYQTAMDDQRRPKS